jgi:hypothetical protein
MDSDDFALRVRFDPVPAARKTPQPAGSLTHNHSTLEGMLYPIVILNQQGSIRFMNAEARRLLAEGLDQRLAAHIRSHPEMGPITQVRFKLQNGHDLVLKIRLGEIEWLGEKAIQVSMCNVTPYLAVIQELQRELGTRKQASEELAGRAPRESPAPATAQARAQEQELLQSHLRDETAGRLAAEAEIERLHGQPWRAKLQEAKLDEMDADFLAEMRQEIQAVLKAAAPYPLRAAASANPRGMSPHAAAAQRAR